MCIGTSAPRKRMMDQELAIRCLALREGIDWYRPPAPRFLNEYCARENKAGEERLQDLASVFQRGMRNVASTFGKNGFRLTDMQGERTERNINTALAEAQFCTLVDYSTESVRQSRGDLIRTLGQVHSDDEFLDTIRRATTDRTRTINRLARYRSAVQGVIGSPVG